MYQDFDYRRHFDTQPKREHTNSIKYDWRTKIFGKNDLIPLWVADMDFLPPDFLIQALREKLTNNVFGYTFPGKDLIHSIINWNKKNYQREVLEGSICFGPGIVPMIHLIIENLTDKFDKILIQPPVYHPFKEAILTHKRQVLENPLIDSSEGYIFDIEDLRKKLALKPSLFIFCNPHNPVGRAWDKKELFQISEALLEYEVPCISDEIHADIQLNENSTHIPLVNSHPEIYKLVITLSSASKAFNLAGLNYSYAITDSVDLNNKVHEIINSRYLGLGSITSQIAMQTVYMHGNEYLKQQNRYLKEGRNLLINNLNARIKIHSTEATYLAWLDVRDFHYSNERLMEMLVQNGVGLIDGCIFGKEGNGYFRLNFATQHKVLLDSIHRINQVFSKI